MTSDGEINCDDYPLFDFQSIVKFAEKYIQSQVDEEWTDYTINRKYVYLLISSRSVEVVTKNPNYINAQTSSYQREFDETFGKFDNKEEALDYLANLDDAKQC